MKRMLTNKGVWLGVLVSGIALYFFAQKVDFGELAVAVRDARHWWLVPMLLANVLTLYIRSLRWNYLLHHEKETTTWSLYIANTIGFMANNLLPARLGELVRAYVAARKERIPVSGCLASLFVERIYDMLSILAMLAAVVIAHSFGIGLRRDAEMPELIITGGYTGLIIAVVLVAVLVVLKSNEGLFLKVSHFMTSFLPESLRERVLSFQQNFIASLTLLRDAKTVLMAVWYSVLMWGAFICTIYCVYWAFGITEFTVFHAMFLLVAIALGIMVPAGPGFIGTYHYACTLALTFMFGGLVSASTAGAIAIVMHLMGFVPVTILGLAYLFLEGMSFSELEHQVEEIQAEEEE